MVSSGAQRDRHLVFTAVSIYGVYSEPENIQNAVQLSNRDVARPACGFLGIRRWPGVVSLWKGMVPCSGPGSRALVDPARGPGE